MKSNESSKLMRGSRSPSHDSNGSLLSGSSLPGELNHEGISRSLKFMAQNYMQPIRLMDVAAVSGLSRRGFIKAFNRHIGRTPGAFMREARIEFAKQLLTEQDLSLKTIATTAGFRSENTFCVAFSRATGIAPKRFQRMAWLSAYRTVGFHKSHTSTGTK